MEEEAAGEEKKNAAERYMAALEQIKDLSSALAMKDAIIAQKDAIIDKKDALLLEMTKTKKEAAPAVSKEAEDDAPVVGLGRGSKVKVVSALSQVTNFQSTLLVRLVSEGDSLTSSSCRRHQGSVLVSRCFLLSSSAPQRKN